MSTTSTRAEVNECIVIDIFIPKLSESVTTRFMLYYAAGIQRITIGTHRAESNRSTICPHLTNTAIICTVRHHNNQGLIQIVLCNFWYTKCIIKHGIIITFQTYATGKGCLKLSITDGIDSTNTCFWRNSNSGMYIEIIAISSIRFYAKEVFHLFLHSCHIFTLTDILGIKAIA